MSNVGWNTVYILWASIGLIGLGATFMAKSKKVSVGAEDK
jgi:hypothetical protein